MDSAYYFREKAARCRLLLAVATNPEVREQLRLWVWEFEDRAPPRGEDRGDSECAQGGGGYARSDSASPSCGACTSNCTASPLPTKGIAAFLRSDHQGRPSLPGVEPRQGRALRELAHGLAAARRGRLDHQLQRAQDAAEQRKHQQQRPGTGTDRGSGCRSGCKQADGVND
jgi:hypothetical protein